MTLCDVDPGARCVISRMTATGSLGQRLADLGFCPGVEVRMLRHAPLHDPVEIELDGCCISIRRTEARQIGVCPA
ncbi:FeoA family protein [Nitratidesulfovibrio sp.]|uniref:FeoA family protein n=1 Tax=Nitratidesulfovibrio sp. TaxID=2802297 RepID=UPI003341AE97